MVSILSDSVIEVLSGHSQMLFEFLFSKSINFLGPAGAVRGREVRVISCQLELSKHSRGQLRAECTGSI